MTWWGVLSGIVICFDVVAPSAYNDLVVVSERFVVSASVAVDWDSFICRRWSAFFTKDKSSSSEPWDKTRRGYEDVVVLG